jgi:hypothetical protein
MADTVTKLFMAITIIVLITGIFYLWVGSPQF